jgi:pyrrolidone-carboxylate peptidase
VGSKEVMPKLILTGFSVFSGVEKNPTEDIICALKDWTSTLSEDELKLALRGYDLSTSVLVCSVDSVQDFLLEQIVVMEGCSGDDVILVHLGN